MVKERSIFKVTDCDSIFYFPFLNGFIETACVEANLKEKYVIRFKKNKGGAIDLDENNKPITEKIYGDIKVIHRDDFDDLTESFEINKDFVTTVLKDR